MAALVNIVGSDFFVQLLDVLCTLNRFCFALVTRFFSFLLTHSSAQKASSPGSTRSDLLTDTAGVEVDFSVCCIVVVVTLSLVKRELEFELCLIVFACQFLSIFLIFVGLECIEAVSEYSVRRAFNITPRLFLRALAK